MLCSCWFSKVQFGLICYNFNRTYILCCPAHQPVNPQQRGA